jgi:CubicO group peptidase (beta-lactamase class C family)
VKLSQAAAAAPRDPGLEALLGEMVDGGVASATVAVCGASGQIEAVAAAGRTRSQGGRPVRPTDRFDLASLTKPFAATLALTLDSRGLLPLNARVGEIWGDRVRSRLSDRPLESLLRHRSGLSAWAPLYRRCRSREAVVDYLLSPAALGDRRERYSDLDYLLWGLTAERALAEPYDRILRRHVLRPLGLGDSGGVTWSPRARGAVLETLLGNSRERELAAAQGVRVARRGGPAVGEVQDGNSRFLGGVAAHAGLFASALHMWRLAHEWLAPSLLLGREAVDRALAGGRRFNLGWRRRTLRGSGGPALGPAAFGHLGFTGGSVFADPESDRIMVLLAHRVSAANDLKGWRRRLHRQMQR